MSTYNHNRKLTVWHKLLSHVKREYQNISRLSIAIETGLTTIAAAAADEIIPSQNECSSLQRILPSSQLPTKISNRNDDDSYD
jgi:hypothetical protein